MKLAKPCRKGRPRTDIYDCKSPARLEWVWWSPEYGNSVEYLTARNSENSQNETFALWRIPAKRSAQPTPSDVSWLVSRCLRTATAWRDWHPWQLNRSQGNSSSHLVIPETHIFAPENRPSKKLKGNSSSEPTIHFQVLYTSCSFQGGAPRHPGWNFPPRHARGENCCHHENASRGQPRAMWHHKWAHPDSATVHPKKQGWRGRTSDRKHCWDSKVFFLNLSQPWCFPTSFIAQKPGCLRTKDDVRSKTERAWKIQRPTFSKSTHFTPRCARLYSMAQPVTPPPTMTPGYITCWMRVETPNNFEVCRPCNNFSGNNEKINCMTASAWILMVPYLKYTPWN